MNDIHCGGREGGGREEGRERCESSVAFLLRKRGIERERGREKEGERGNSGSITLSVTVWLWLH